MPTETSLTTLAVQKQNVLPNKATSLDSFLQELKTVLDQRMLPERAINYLFSDASPFHPTCAGDWMEFGVFHGDTINYAAKARQATCGDTCPPIFGFDTFTGTAACRALLIPGTCNPQQEICMVPVSEICTKPASEAAIPVAGKHRCRLYVHAVPVARALERLHKRQDESSTEG